MASPPSYYLLTSLALVVGMDAPVAYAESQDTLDEIVVSARKRAENAQDVPISLSEVGAGELQDRGLVTLQDVVRVMPNVTMDVLQPRAASLAIRGLGRNPANEALESSVGVFLDGVYLGRPGMMVADYIDIASIEVLRGPQGALFGKNATAGVVNITTTPPSSDPEGWIELSAGDHGLRELRGAVSGPIGDTTAGFRLSGFATGRDGFVYDTVRDEWLGETNRTGARGQLAWQAGDHTSLRLVADYASQDEAGPGLLLTDLNAVRDDGSIRATSLASRGARMGYSARASRSERLNEADAAQRVATENAGAVLLADWAIGEYRLSSITGWRKWDYKPANDGDFSALDVLSRLGASVRASQTSQELRLASPADGQFQYLAGVYLYDQEVLGHVFAEYGADSSEYLFPGLPASALEGLKVYTDSDPRTRSYAVFGQAFWWPREKLEIAAGMRFTTEHKDATVERYAEGSAASARTEVAVSEARQALGGARRVSAAWDEDFVSGSLSFSWHFADDTIVYLSAARGAKSGGVNAALVPPGASQTVGPEIALGFEAGVKTHGLADRLQFNASAFHTTVEGYQASIRDRAVGATYLDNAGTVRSTGIEAEAVYRPVSKVSLSAAVGYNDARYESFRSAPCPPERDNEPVCDLSGERLAGASPLTVSGTVAYDNPVMSGRYELRTFVEYFHSDAYRSELPRSARVSAYGLVNLRATLGTADERRSLTLWANNLLDEDYFTSFAVQGPANSAMAVGTLGAPRTLGVSLQLRY